MVRRVSTSNSSMSFRQQANGKAIDLLLRTVSSIGKLHPLARLEDHGVEVIRNVPYRQDVAPGQPGANLLDVYRPPGDGPFPAVLYVHGGGFRILSKDTHWVMAAALVREGYMVFCPNYRLAPAHPFPAAVEDACEIYRFVVERGASFGADLSRLAVAGESAGANLATAISVACATRRPEPFARAVYDLDHMPRAFIPFCGLLQASNITRYFERRSDLSPLVVGRMKAVSGDYLNGRPEGVDLAMADPVVVYEGLETTERALPPFFIPVGTADPILDDSRRLHEALGELGVQSHLEYYPGEVHAFHALVWRPEAQRCWRETHSFLNQHLAAG